MPHTALARLSDLSCIPSPETDGLHTSSNYASGTPVAEIAVLLHEDLDQVPVAVAGQILRPLRCGAATPTKVILCLA